ncbi:hypothetical protein D4L84_09130, partial [Campylobacter coli]
MEGLRRVVFTSTYCLFPSRQQLLLEPCVCRQQTTNRDENKTRVWGCRCIPAASEAVEMKSSKDGGQRIQLLNHMRRAGCCGGSFCAHYTRLPRDWLPGRGVWGLSSPCIFRS